ncbi:hypothetical protein TWF102_003578 [Orbilia oligospora]|uniref:Uncharacterized protein n=1 Tax=Orbilia oligospora TaxID=2813651 RepID=A0A7C8N2D0_ORBOL|nr:hypothetical protein TWF102_003578 [Orbilia oligospora]
MTVEAFESQFILRVWGIKEKSRSKTRRISEALEGIRVCVTPVYIDEELEEKGYEQWVSVELSPTLGSEIEGEGEANCSLQASTGMRTLVSGFGFTVLRFKKYMEIIKIEFL